MPTPTHLLPDSCHVCGTPSPCRHNFTNAQADAAAAAHDARATFVYPGGQTNAEAAYVDQVIGR